MVIGQGRGVNFLGRVFLFEFLLPINFEDEFFYHFVRGHS